MYPPLAVPDRARPLDRLHGTRDARSDALVGLGAARADDVRRRLPHRSQRAQLERDRRRLRRRDRRRAHRPRRVAVRPHADRGEPEGVRAEGRRTARSATASRRTAAASPRTRAATRTGRSRTRATSPAISRSAGAASGTTCPPRTRPSIAFDLLCILGLALVGLRFGGAAARCDARVLVDRVSVHAVRVELEHERRDLPAFLIWGFWLVTSPVRARLLPRARRLDEVRGADRRADVGDVSDGLRRRAASSASSAGFALATRRWRSRSSCSSRTSATRCACSGSGRCRGRSAASRRSRSGTGGQYHAKGIPNLQHRPALARGARRRRRVRVRDRPAASRRRCSSPR